MNLKKTPIPVLVVLFMLPLGLVANAALGVTPISVSTVDDSDRLQRELIATAAKTILNIGGLGCDSQAYCLSLKK